MSGVRGREGGREGIHLNSNNEGVPQSAEHKSSSGHWTSALTQAPC